MVRSVGVTTNLEKNRAEIAYSFFKLAQNLIKITGIVVQLQLYTCTKFEENRSTRRLFLRDLKLFLVWCEEEEEKEKEKYEENQTTFENKYLANCWSDFFQIWYVRWCICRA